MAYYVVMGKDKKIDISKLEGFKKKSRFKEGFSLEEIDACTLKYDEDRFRAKLCMKGLITIDDISSPISIKQRINKGLKTVTYGIAYSDAFSYFNIDNLMYALKNKYKDNEFLRKFINHYHNSYTNSCTLSIIASAMGRGDLETIYVRLGEFFENELFRTDANTGEAKLNYKAYHDLAMFIYNYDMKKAKEKELVSTSKKRVRKLDNKNSSTLEGQISLFDE